MTTQYILEGSQVSAIKQGDIYTYYAYDTDGAPIGMFCPSTPTEELTGANEYFFVKNLQGDILKVVDNVGDTIITYHYNAWGEITSETVAVGYENIAERNIFRYRGYIYDTETQLYYLQSRYYDPAICRFLNADSWLATGQGLIGNNMYAYCLNNPVNYTDPSGEDALAKKVLGAFIITLVAAAIATVAVATAPISAVIAVAALASVFIAPLAWMAMDIAVDISEGIKEGKNTTIVPDTGSNTKNGNTTTIPTATRTEKFARNLESIAGKYRNFECDKAANAMTKHLRGNNQNGVFIELFFPGARDGWVISVTYPKNAISHNGYHCGVLYNGLVYCNVHPYGLPESKWINDFIDMWGPTNIIKRTPF